MRHRALGVDLDLDVPAGVDLRRRTTGSWLSWAGEPLPRPLYLPPCSCWIASAAWSVVFGVVLLPTHSPMRNGSLPHFASSPRRIDLAGADQGGGPLELLDASAAAGCTASGRPRPAPPSDRRPRPGAAAGPSCRPTGRGTPRSCRRPWGTRGGRRSPRRRRERSWWSSLVIPGRLSRTKANWKGYHDRLAGTSMARSSTGSSRLLLSETIVRTRCCHMARLANRNASAACSSSCSSVSPASMRPRASRHRPRAVWPGVWYGAMSGLARSACRSSIHAA